MISVGVRLAAFNLKEIANLTCTDELDLASIGEKKVALFCCIPDADTSLNYLVGMIYSNLFQTLYYVADRKYGGRLPVPVHCIMDEWPNVALPDDFDKILATMRSRAISCSIIIQNMAQMKALFKDSWESLVGNCDELLYLGGNEKEGHKYISELLGKETLDTNTYGQTKGRNGSYSTNYQQTGRELFTPDEIRLLDNRKAILFVRGERPMLDDKADSENQVKIWSSILENETYELVYYGRRSFGVMDGLRYLPGDADGDGVDQGSENFTQLFNGGEIVGFEVSLHMPAVKDITPVRYMMEPEYISQEVLDKEQMDEVKDVESWTVDQKDGSMYFFLDDKIGWRLVVADAAAGNRFYQLEKTADGGDTWEMENQNPFGGNLGVTEGLEFFDKNFGFAGLTGASQSYSSLYVTRDGGTTFTELQLPLETVTELPPLAKELNFTIENYKYCEMPKKKEDILTIKLLTGAGEIQGIRFESKDNGETWAYDGISVE